MYVIILEEVMSFKFFFYCCPRIFLLTFAKFETYTCFTLGKNTMSVYQVSYKKNNLFCVPNRGGPPRGGNMMRGGRGNGPGGGMRGGPPMRGRGGPPGRGGRGGHFPPG